MTTNKVKLPVSFAEDNRKKPRLHALHVGYYMEAFKILLPVVRDLTTLSTVFADIVAGKIMQEIRDECLSDAAAFEAFTLCTLGCEVAHNDETKGEPE